MTMQQSSGDSGALNALSEQIQGRSCTLFAGSGLNVAAGLPTRAALLGELLERFASTVHEPQVTQTLPEDDLEAMFHIIATDHREQVAGFIRDRVSEWKPPSSLHQVLSRIEFAGIITTNWDQILEETFPAATVAFPLDAKDVQSLQLKNSLFLLRLSGSPAKPDSLVFSRRDLERSLATNTALATALDSLLQRHSLLFAGCNWEDIDTFFRGIRYFNPSGRHFALMQRQGPSWLAKARRFAEDYHLEVIPYDDQNEMLEILSHLANLRVKEPTLRGHAAGVMAVAVVSDQYIFSGSEDSSARLWDLESRQTTTQFIEHTDAINSVAIAPAAKLAATGSSDSTVCIWELSTGRMLRRFKAHESQVRSVALFGTPLRLVSSGSDGLVKVWDASTGDLLLTLRGPKMDLNVWTVAVAADGSIFGGGESLFLWEPSGGERPAVSLSGHSKEVVALAITPDGRKLVSGSVDGTVGIWNLATSKMEHQKRAAGEVSAVAVSPDGTRAVSASGGILEVWNLNNGDRIRSFEAHHDRILSVAVTSDGESVITGSEDTTIKIWKLPRAISRIRRARFQNIGPFEDLTIEFRSNWTILLGNNGTGKSTILKALALALTGKEAGSVAADPLIREGAKEPAIIIVETDNEVYKTVLSKNLGASADVQWPPIRAIEREGMLILGFPPMRSGSRTSASTISLEDTPIPTSDDLLPLVQGVVDTRINRLKEWLMGLNVRTDSKGESLRPVAEDLFERVSGLLKGTEVSFARVDGGVIVNTIDGSLPIEQISQGMTSLISWVGVLWQRLYEVYGTNAEDRHAVVLMDEIDAHMHPHWQQLLVTELKKIFPNVQFIATTHSPLIVAGRSRDEILVCTRDETTRRPRLDRLSMDFERLRADQILTSPAFGLDGARDYETVLKQGLYRKLLENLHLTEKESQELAILREDPAIACLPVEETVYSRSIVSGLRKQLIESVHITGEESDRLFEEERLARERLIGELRS
jgi:WD40 repeat protein/energy-coupling factor transporter ATP-binding protein EcfA2